MNETEDESETQFPEPFNTAAKYAYGPGIDSYNRMERCLDIMRQLPRRDSYRLLGGAWPCCDNIASHYDEVLKWLDSANQEDLAAMMADEDRSKLGTLPETLTVWRGCYGFNYRGLSWSLSDKIAEGFPFLLRYYHQGQRPLLVKGRVRRRDAVLISDREEQEIISSKVEAMKIYTLHWRKRKDEGRLNGPPPKISRRLYF